MRRRSCSAPADDSFAAEKDDGRRHDFARAETTALAGEALVDADGQANVN